MLLASDHNKANSGEFGNQYEQLAADIAVLCWVAVAVVEIHWWYPCGCLKMHRIMGIKGAPICPA